MKPESEKRKAKLQKILDAIPELDDTEIKVIYERTRDRTDDSIAYIMAGALDHAEAAFDKYISDSELDIEVAFDGSATFYWLDGKVRKTVRLSNTDGHHEEEKE